MQRVRDCRGKDEEGTSCTPWRLRWSAALWNAPTARSDPAPRYAQFTGVLIQSRRVSDPVCHVSLAGGCIPVQLMKHRTHRYLKPEPPSTVSARVCFGDMKEPKRQERSLPYERNHPNGDQGRSRHPSARPAYFVSSGLCKRHSAGGLLQFRIWDRSACLQGCCVCRSRL